MTEPRVWAMPEIPADVERLRDRDGDEWIRVAGSADGDWETDTDDPARYGYASPHQLIADLGPLTEVVEEATP